MKKEWLDRKAAARHCSVGTTVFDSHIRPFVSVVYIGSKPLFDAADLDEYLSKKKVNPDDIEL